MSKKAEAQPPKSYEEALRELEQIIAEIERGEAGLETILARYERGVVLLEYCGKTLEAAEKQVQVLTRGPGGTLTAAPLAGGEAPAPGNGGINGEDEGAEADQTPGT